MEKKRLEGAKDGKFKINFSWHSSFVSFTLDAEEIERQIAQAQASLNDCGNELKNVINYSIRGDDTREKIPRIRTVKLDFNLAQHSRLQQSKRIESERQ